MYSIEFAREIRKTPSRGSRTCGTFPYKEEYEGIHRQRQIDVAIQLFEAMGIERDDKEKRMDWMLRGFRQFDAPVSLVLTYNKYLEPAAISQFSLGLACLRHRLGGVGAWFGLRYQWSRYHAVRRGS